MVCEAPVNVTVDVPAVKVAEEPDVSQEPERVMDPLVRDRDVVDASVIATLETERLDVVATRDPPLDRVRLAPPVTALPPVVNVPVIVKELLTATDVVALTVPTIVKSRNPFAAFSVASVVAAPESVTEAVPTVNADPAPEVSQFPCTVHDPVVRVSAPDVPPFIARLTTDTMDAFAVRIAEFPMDNDPPVNGRFPVTRLVVEPALS